MDQPRESKNGGEQTMSKSVNRLFNTTLAGAAGAVLAFASAFAIADQEFNDWGWPQPYEQISEESIDWLKDRGWWPISMAYQAPWSGANTLNVVMVHGGLLEARGIEANLTSFGTGPEINEVIASGRAQVGIGGNFPFTSLVERGVPIQTIGVLTPNLLHATIVPNDSEIESFEDFANRDRPAVVGLATGSSAEFYFVQAAAVHGVEIGKDVQLRNMSLPEQMTMPRGLDAVVPWDAAATIISEFHERGRVVDTIYSYNFYQGNQYVRQELIDNVPDVVQAITDAFIEASLWIRLNPDQAVDLLAKQPELETWDRELLAQQTAMHNNLYKPTAAYPFAEFWSKENERISKWLYEGGRLNSMVTAADYEAAFDASFMEETFNKLGWKVPDQPPFLPAGWDHEIGDLPYPEYDSSATLTDPQPWPEPQDLVAPWEFDGTRYTPED
ncbi:sulfonate transport system substrate-binding protein [Natronocella acetinitrilica]|uniref:Sulfonate transport system substrate-binding protein n=1 Tax=Natronocella acetinitrilica TaxID=414046 RepID=A0AAE3G185_9GAMM|nr:ABC transporter substrate-binding protein [Natronocella acetinitrilica]MCP1673659.1 sulfonate transport system substrate-binding protein [Natronocella acetinitrilica]